jgi:hypothetical protein
VSTRTFELLRVTEENTRGCMACYPEGEPDPDRPLIKVVLGYGSFLVCDACAGRLGTMLARSFPPVD